MISYIVILLLICIIGLVYSKEDFQPAPFVSFDDLYDTSLYIDVYDFKIGPDGIPGEKGNNATGRKYLNYVSELAHRTTTTKRPATTTTTKPPTTTTKPPATTKKPPATTKKPPTTTTKPPTTTKKPLTTTTKALTTTTKAPYETVTYSTDPTDAGGGNVFFLDKHHINCGNNGINQFKYSNPGNNTLRYDYTCLEELNEMNSDINYTNYATSGGNTIYLDKLHVNCDNNPILNFKLHTEDYNIRYNYQCGTRSAPQNDCRDIKTRESEESSNSAFLDKQNVICNHDEVLTQFKLNRDGQKWWYAYRCCKPQ